MSPFDALVVGHLIGDYLLQSNWMAVNKAEKWDALAFHSLIYTLAVAFVARIFSEGISFWGFLLIFVLHVFLDRRTFVRWWVKTIMKADGDGAGWLTIMADQAFHVVVLAVALYI